MTIELITTGRGGRIHDLEIISTAVIEAVVAKAGVDPITLPPLYEWIDPDALDAMFASTAGKESGVVNVEFSYYGYAITVTRDGETTITVEEQPDERV